MTNNNEIIGELKRFYFKIDFSLMGEIRNKVEHKYDMLVYDHLDYYNPNNWAEELANMELFDRNK